MRKPSWLKIRLPSNQNFFYVSNLVKNNKINTICQSAKCPNISQCWSERTATFLILGDTCTRNCAFCAVKKGNPAPVSKEEADKIADTVYRMGLRYTVITSVTRDDLNDGGAGHFAHIIKTVRTKIPDVLIEVLIPDFQGDDNSLSAVIDANPEVLNHNIEVPERIYPTVRRPVENYLRSIELLGKAKEMGMITKSGMMIGLGESWKEIIQTFSDLRENQCDLLTIGQYLQPSRHHIPVKKYYSPLEFEQLKKIALDQGFREVESGPLIRSSFGAQRMYRSLMVNN